MSNTQPTEPLPPRPETAPPHDHYAPPPYQPGPYGPASGVPAEPFYKRHGLAFAISTLVLAIVVFLGLVTAGAFAVASVVTHVGERAISRILPPGPEHGQPVIPGKPEDGGGKGNGGAQGGTSQSRVLVRGTIASLSGDTWTIERQNGATVDVTIDSSTVFGTPAKAAAKSDFAKGDEVIVVGERSDGTVRATRVLKLDTFPTRPPSTPGTSTPGS
jgi:hypothetical protein